MTVAEAMEHVFAAFGDDAAFVCANGYVSRDAFAIDDRPGSFYMLGSMGLTASIALGAALARPQKRVVVLDGDGNVLMGLGSLALVGSQAPGNLVHLCFDNGVYASTGNQPTIAAAVSLEGIAREAGYAVARRVETPDELAAALAELAAGAGPSFCRVMVRPQEHPRDFPRVSHSPTEIRDRFSAALAGPGA